MRGCRGRVAARLVLLGPVSAALALCGGAPAAGAADRAARPPDLTMVVAGGAGQPTAVRSGEVRFARLWQLLEPMHTGTERVPEAWSEGRYPPVRITVVWGLTGVGGWPTTDSPPGGDVAIERQDQLFVAEDGTPWVRSDPAPDVEDDDIRWHRAPRSVFERLDRAGLLGAPASGASAGTDGSVPAADAVWWAIPGLAVGFAAGVGGTLAIRRAAARPGGGPPREEPRQQLIDL
ncbi:hypothetical protein [Streptomyces sp. P17]|uniref:hypothetical protein n=1 Tax=Streptomyces sp. P17 TaxID=3074716 RepID=UPI0028F459CF|nr:hypothetical protein [Streptomyces sp. P17]MDT9698991.1 hypothetical protein [Streptomyces sp. P17]